MRLKAAPKMGATASAPTQHFLPHKLTLFVLGAPISVSLVYLVPLARSRYCASPEASILTKAKAKLEHPPTEGRQLRTKNYELMHREP